MRVCFFFFNVTATTEIYTRGHASAQLQHSLLTATQQIALATKHTFPGVSHSGVYAMYYVVTMLNSALENNIDTVRRL